MSDARIITCASCDWHGEDACPECHTPHPPRRIFIDIDGGLISSIGADPGIQIYILDTEFIKEGDDSDVLNVDTHDGAFLKADPNTQGPDAVEDCLNEARTFVRKVQEERRHEVRPGSTRLVFDAKAWGGCDVGDNSQFWKKATVIDIHTKGEEKYADVRFSDTKVSLGHLVSAMRPVGSNPAELQAPKSGWKG
jgi:hypothetical protein